MNYVLSLFKNSDDSKSSVEKAKVALRAVRQYQQDWQEHWVDRVHKYFYNVECTHYSSKTMTFDLNTLNDLNIVTAGKICFVKVKDAEDTLLPIYSVDEFKPDQHSLVLDQIWTFEQEQIVRKLLEYLYTGGIETLGETIMWQRILIEWLDQNLSYVDGVLND